MIQDWAVPPMLLAWEAKVNICKVLRQPNGLTLAMQQLFLKALAPWVCFSH